jgi:hypothetical protein
MHRRRGAVAACLAGLMLAACGGGRVLHRVETTAPDDPARATRPGSADSTGTVESSSAARPPPLIDTPPDFPPNYRMRIATYLAVEYVEFGKGPPEITDLTTNSSFIGASTSVCVRYPARPAAPSYSSTRSIRIWGSRGLASFGRTEFKKQTLGILAGCTGELKPFVELEQVAQRLRECAGRGERNCVVNVEPNRRDTLVLPVKRQWDHTPRERPD